MRPGCICVCDYWGDVIGRLCRLPSSNFGEPHFRDLKPAGRVAAVSGPPSGGRLSPTSASKGQRPTNEALQFLSVQVLGLPRRVGVVVKLVRVLHQVS